MSSYPSQQSVSYSLKLYFGVNMTSGYVVTKLYSCDGDSLGTDELSPWSTALPEKLTGPQLVKKLPSFYGA